MKEHCFSCSVRHFPLTRRQIHDSSKEFTQFHWQIAHSSELAEGVPTCMSASSVTDDAANEKIAHIPQRGK